MYMTTKKTHQRTYKALRILATLSGPISHTPLMLSSRPSSMTFCFVQPQESWELWGKARREAFYLPLIVNEDHTRTLYLVIFLLGEKPVCAKNSNRRTMLRREERWSLSTDCTIAEQTTLHAISKDVSADYKRQMRYLCLRILFAA